MRILEFISGPSVSHSKVCAMVTIDCNKDVAFYITLIFF